MVEQIVGASKPQGLFEIRIGVRRRRRWSDKIKGQIAAESGTAVRDPDVI
jgi:hypothetical protein